MPVCIGLRIPLLLIAWDYRFNLQFLLVHNVHEFSVTLLLADNYIVTVFDDLLQFVIKFDFHYIKHPDTIISFFVPDSLHHCFMFAVGVSILFAA